MQLDQWQRVSVYVSASIRGLFVNEGYHGNSYWRQIDVEHIAEDRGSEEIKER